MSTDETKHFYSWRKCQPDVVFQRFSVRYDCFSWHLPPCVQLSFHSSSSSSRKWGQIHQWMVGEQQSAAAAFFATNPVVPSQPWPLQLHLTPRLLRTSQWKYVFALETLWAASICSASFGVSALSRAVDSARGKLVWTSNLGFFIFKTGVWRIGMMVSKYLTSWSCAVLCGLTVEEHSALSVLNLIFADLVSRLQAETEKARTSGSSRSSSRHHRVCILLTHFLFISFLLPVFLHHPLFPLPFCVSTLPGAGWRCFVSPQLQGVYPTPVCSWKRNNHWSTVFIYSFPMSKRIDFSSKSTSSAVRDLGSSKSLSSSRRKDVMVRWCEGACMSVT